MAMAQDIPATSAVLFDECTQLQQQVLELQATIERNRLNFQETLTKAHEESDRLRLLNAQWQAKHREQLIRADDQRRLCEQRLDTILQSKSDAPPQPVLKLSAPLQLHPAWAEPPIADASHQSMVEWLALNDARFEQAHRDLEASCSEAAQGQRQAQLLQGAVDERDAQIRKLQRQLGQWLLSPHSRQHSETRTRQLEEQLLYFQQHYSQLEDQLAKAHEEAQQAHTTHARKSQAWVDHMQRYEHRQDQMRDQLLQLERLVTELEKQPLLNTAAMVAPSTGPFRHSGADEPASSLENLRSQLQAVETDRDNLRHLYEQTLREVRVLQAQLRSKPTAVRTPQSAPGSAAASPALGQANLRSSSPAGDTPLRTGSSGTQPPPTGSEYALVLGDVRAVIEYLHNRLRPSPARSSVPVCLASATRPLADLLHRLDRHLSDQEATFTVTQQDRLAETTQALSDLRTRYWTISDDYQRIRQELEQLKPSKATKAPSLASEGPPLRQRLDALLAQHQALTQDHAKLDVTLRNAIQEVEKLRELLDSAERQNRSLKAFTNELERENQQYRNELTNVKQRNQTMITSIASLEAVSAQVKELSDLQDLLRATELSKDEYKRHALELARDVEQFQAMVRQLEIERDGLAVQVKSRAHRLQREQQQERRL
ncbi:hypothetical protein H4R34_000871 [Dimargaris verticillata]|uniref:Uncharacterized protein n=1 Tax=Dimargaris verticillata TaxID=2761393 RepID=A0A9W8BAZ5_9FUNG|nr:hypothetical protein H4R34_000871 [Dimargaris verticillata]